MGQTIAVVSGKGGTGKTSFTANVGMALAQLGHPTLCLDCDIGLRNLDIALAMTDRAVMDFTDVLSGYCSLSDAIAPHPLQKNLYLLTAPTRLNGTRVSQAALGIWRIRGLSWGRPLASKIWITASALRPLAPRP